MKTFLPILLFLASYDVHCQPMFDKRGDTTNIFIGKINGYTLMYDCHDCGQSVSGGITVNYQARKGKHRLLGQAIFDFYVDDVAILKLQGENFIYISSTHTYGHSQGYLYYLNTWTMKAYEVIRTDSVYKLPDSIHYHKYFDLTRDKENNFSSSASLRTNSGRSGSISSTYQLKKLNSNHFVLVASKPEWGLDEEY